MSAWALEDPENAAFLDALTTATGKTLDELFEGHRLGISLTMDCGAIFGVLRGKDQRDEWVYQVVVLRICNDPSHHLNGAAMTGARILPFTQAKARA